MEKNRVRTRSALGVLAPLLHGLPLAAFAGIVVAGCSAKSSEPYPDVASFCAAKAQAECQVSSTCGFKDSSDCEKQRVSLCNAEANTAASTGSRTRKYTQANASKCIDKINGAFGNGSTHVPFTQLVGPLSIADLCARVFSGSAAFNEPCQSTYDCTGDNICAPAFPGATASVCAPATPIAAGALCQNPGSVCAPDTYCAMANMNVGFTCTRSRQEGQPCADAPCVSTERCEATGATGHTCEPRATPSDPCATDDDCPPSAPYCDPYVGNFCDEGLSFAFMAPDCKGFETGAALPVADAGAHD